MTDATMPGSRPKREPTREPFAALGAVTVRANAPSSPSSFPVVATDLV
jgi:hypothetical protein